MSHKNRTSAKVLTEGKLITNQPKYVMKSSPTLQHVQQLTRDTLNLISLGALQVQPHVISDLNLVIRELITQTGATYLVPRSQANECLSLARQDYPESILGEPIGVPVQVYGQMITLVPLIVREKRR